MKDLQKRPTISYGSKGNRSRYGLTQPPPAAHISYRPDMVGRQYGWVKIISPEKRWGAHWAHCRVLTQCTGCGSIQWQLLNELQRGRSRGCQHCSQPRRIPHWLKHRLTSAKQRCENPCDPGYRNCGARGIRFEFASVTEAGQYLIETYGLPERSMELDRIDNNGNYARGNLRFVSHAQNSCNRRATVLSRFEQMYWPYARSVVTRNLTQGFTRAEIIRDAERAVSDRRKNWQLIRARLEFMTYEMPDDITVLPYRTSSYTTVAMAAQSEH